MAGTLGTVIQSGDSVYLCLLQHRGGPKGIKMKPDVLILPRGTDENGDPRILCVHPVILPRYECEPYVVLIPLTT